MATNQYRGQIVDRMQDGKIVYETRTYATWGAAQGAAERACNRRYGRGNDRYGVRVE